MRGDRKLSKPAPYPYKDKGYTFLNAVFDNTLKRFDENTKVREFIEIKMVFGTKLNVFQVIVVDGPIASGKSVFAKALADELEMHFVPEASLDLLYVNSYGFDMRTLNSELPATTKCFDEKDFCRNPKHRLASNFQIQKYILRFEQYVDSLAHLLSTGQGLVFDRSCYSDFVFMETMFRNNMINRDVRRVYNELKANTIGELLRPHLAIYLDVPVDKTMDNIKKRANEWELKSPILSEKYLSDMESIYKQQYLKDISVHAELLVYDWTHGGDTEVVVEDIQRIGMEMKICWS